MTAKVYSGFAFSIICLSFMFCNCLKIIPEHASVTYINHNHLKYAKLYVNRYGRKSPYFINLELNLIKPWNNNITFNFVFFEYLHNEYRRSFVEIHLKLCDFLEKDPYLGKMLTSEGVKCPVAAGPWNLRNMTVPTQTPFKWPFEKCRIDGNITVTTTGESVFKYSLYALFKEK